MDDLAKNRTVVIRPTKGLLEINAAEIWRYRDLLLLLVYRDFSAKYRQTVLGPLWYVVQPLLTTLMFMVVFGRIAAIPTDGLPPALFYLAGLLCWGYFALVFQQVSNTLSQNANLFGKVYFPRLVVPLSSVISNSAAFAIQFVAFMMVWLFFKLLTPAGATMGLSAATLLFPLIILQVAALSLGVGLWLSALTAKYRDFTFLATFVLQLWMYATPIVYPFSQIPAGLRWVGYLNPMAMPVEATKLLFLGQGVVTPAYEAISLAITAALLVSGLIIFNRVEKTFVDTV